MPWPGRDRRVGALLGFSLSRACSTTVQGAVFRVDTRGRDEPCTTHISGNPAASLRSRDPSPDAQGHDPGIRRRAGSIEPRAPPSGSDPARNASHERDRASHQPSSPLARLAGRLARAPSRRRPAPPASFTVPSPTRRARAAGPRRRFVFEPSTRPDPLRGRLAAHPSRGGPRPPLPGGPRRPCLQGNRSGPGSREPDRWWAPLSPGGPSLVRFRPSSNRLAGASSRRRLACAPFGPLRTLRAIHLGRDAPSPERLRPLFTPFRSLSRSRRLSPPGCPSRTGSFR